MADQEKKAKESKESKKAPEEGKTDVNKEVKKVVKKAKSKRRNIPLGRAYVQASYNNTIVTLTDDNGNVLAWSSAGGSGFKGARKATPYAAQVSAEKAVEKAKLFGLERVHVFVNGVGSGREQAIRGLVASGLNLVSISDLTPMPHNGCRKKKARRI